MAEGASTSGFEGEHPPVGTLLAYYHRELSAAAHAQLTQHLQNCLECRLIHAKMDRIISTQRRQAERRRSCPPLEMVFRQARRSGLEGQVREDSHLAGCPLCSQDLERIREVLAHADRGRAHFLEPTECVPNAPIPSSRSPRRGRLPWVGITLALGGGMLALGIALWPESALEGTDAQSKKELSTLEPTNRQEELVRILVYRYGPGTALTPIDEGSATGLYVSQSLGLERPEQGVFRVGSPPGESGIIALTPRAPLTPEEKEALEALLKETLGGKARLEAKAWAEARARLQAECRGGVWLLNEP